MRPDQSWDVLVDVDVDVDTKTTSNYAFERRHKRRNLLLVDGNWRMNRVCEPLLESRWMSDQQKLSMKPFIFWKRSDWSSFDNVVFFSIDTKCRSTVDDWSVAVASTPKKRKRCERKSGGSRKLLKSTYLGQKASTFLPWIINFCIFQTRLAFGALFCRDERNFPRKSRTSGGSLDSPLSGKMGLSKFPAVLITWFLRN